MGTHPIFESDFDCLTVAERMPRFQKGIGLGMKKERKKVMPEEFQENAWDCTVCTYKNPIHTYKCQICDAPRGSSTRKSRITEQIIQKQQQTQLMAQYGEGSSSILEEVRRQSLADAGKNGLVDEEDEDDDDRSETSEMSSQSSEVRARPNRKQQQRRNRTTAEQSDSNNESENERPTKLKMMPKSKKKRARDGRTDKADISSDDEMPKKPKLSKAKRGRNTAPSSESEEEESEEEENDEDERTEPEPPKKKTKAPRKEDQMTKSIKRVLEKKFQARKAAYGKHRNIDRSTGVETIVQFAGTAFKITEFKLRPQKPRPKNYPEKEKEANGIKEENGEDEEKHETAADKEEESETEDKEAPSPEVSPATPPDPTITSKFHDKPAKENNFEEKFKTAFANTNPKNNSKRGNELTKQLETKKDVAKSIKKSLGKEGEKPPLSEAPPSGEKLTPTPQAA